MDSLKSTPTMETHVNGQMTIDKLADLELVEALLEELDSFYENEKEGGNISTSEKNVNNNQGDMMFYGMLYGT